MALRIGEEKLLVFACRVLKRLELGGDLLSARNVDRKAAVAGRVLLNGRQHLLPFDQLRLLALQSENVRCRLGQSLLDHLSRRAQVVDLVGRAEIDDLLGDLVGLPALLLDVAVNLRDRLVAAQLVLLVGKLLDGLGIGVGESRAKRGRLRPHRNHDDAGVALQLEVRTAQR